MVCSYCTLVCAPEILSCYLNTPSVSKFMVIFHFYRLRYSNPINLFSVRRYLLT